MGINAASWGRVSPLSARRGVSVRAPRLGLGGAAAQLAHQIVAEFRVEPLRQFADIRSSSWAQTAASHVTVSTPSRSAVGRAAAAIAAPAADSQACWTRASVVRASPPS